MNFNNKLNYLLFVPLKIAEFFFRLINFFKKNNIPRKIILIIDIGHFGDQLMLTPAIKHLRESKKTEGYKIYCVTSTLGEKAFKNNSYVDKVYTVNDRWENNYNNYNSIINYFELKYLIKDINPEIAFSCRSTSYYIETFAMYGANVKFRYGYSGKGLKNLFSQTLDYDLKIHRVDQNINLMRLFTKESCTVSRKPYFYPVKSNINKSRIESYICNSKVVLLNIFAEHNYIWELNFYLKIILFYEKKGYKVLLVGTKKNHNRVEDFLNKNKINRKNNLLGKTNIDELYYLLSKAHLLITIDTGIRHLANCIELPTISLRKTPNYDSEFGKYVNSEHVLNEKKGRKKYANTEHNEYLIKPEMLYERYEL